MACFGLFFKSFVCFRNHIHPKIIGLQRNIFASKTSHLKFVGLYPNNICIFCLPAHVHIFHGAHFCGLIVRLF